MTADLTPTEVAALRERANAATPGPWIVADNRHDDDPCILTTDELTIGTRDSAYVAQTRYDDQSQTAHNSDADAAHIAGLDPATVLALLDAAYDDTGQPWRDRAERAEADWLREIEARGAEVKRCDRAEATIDRARTRLRKSEWVVSAELLRVLDGDQEAT